MRFRTLLLSTLLIWQVPRTALAQPILPRLEALGFENLTLEDGKETFTVWYENRRFFLELEAMGRVLAEASRDLEASQSIAAIPQRDRIPLMLVSVNVGDLREFLTGIMTPDVFRQCLTIESPPEHRPEHRVNSSLYRTDLDLTPGYFFSVEFKGWINGTVSPPPSPMASRPLHGGATTSLLGGIGHYVRPTARTWLATTWPDGLLGGRALERQQLRRSWGNRRITR